MQSTLEPIDPEALDRVLSRVTKPARYIGGEWNSIVRDWGDVELKFVLVYPDLYEIGMSNLGQAILYELLNERPEVLMERAFAVWPDMAAALREAGLPIYSLETKRPLKAFDIIGFSLGYEQTYTNVLEVLDLAGLALRAADRGPDDPLVIAGGTCALNPEPMARFIDLFVLGEAEEVILELFDLYRAHRREHAGSDWKQSFLRRAARIRGIYVPSLYEAAYHPDGRLKDIWALEPSAPKLIERRMVRRMPPYPLKPVVPYVELIHDRVGIELFRGCTRGCRYCQAGMIYRPVRERTKEQVLDMADTLLRNTGYEQLSLVSLASGD
jgi:radical SAM superfamily enzyme YgiQ (UPF0313 family)